MSIDRISSLTESQRAYLRLVLQHQSSKRIAQQYNISAHTVDKRIKEAMRILDVGSRVEAARLLAEVEGRSLGPQPPDLAIPPFSATHAYRAGLEDGESGSAGIMLGENPRDFGTHVGARPFPLPFPTPRRRENDLSILQRLGWTIGLIIGLALATGILLSGLSALSTLMVALGR